MRICWATDYMVSGNAYGYSVHNRAMRQYVSRIAELDPEAPVAVTIASADRFVPVPRKKNFLFTMFETNHLPPSYVRNLCFADHIIVPCDHNAAVFRKYTDLPISVCPEGVDPDVFKYRRRTHPMMDSRPFRYLWIAAPNPRKGYRSVLEAWKAFGDNPDVELYLKTTSPKGLPKKSEEAAAALAAARRVPQRVGRNIIFDARDVSISEIVKLYYSAHCFVMPSHGEGWGLTLCEALSTGCPSIATRWGGHEMFFDDEVGYPIKHEIKPFFAVDYGLPTEIAIPDTFDLVRLMSEVYRYYGEATDKANRGSMRIRNKFTWRKAARRLVEIIQEAA